MTRATYAPACPHCGHVLMTVVGPELVDTAASRAAVARWQAAWAEAGPGTRHECECDAEVSHEPALVAAIGLRERDVSRPVLDGCVIGPSGRLRVSGRFLDGAELVVGDPREAGALRREDRLPVTPRLWAPAGSTLDLGDLPSSLPYATVLVRNAHGWRRTGVLRPVLGSRWSAFRTAGKSRGFDLEEHVTAERLAAAGPKPGPERRARLDAELGSRRLVVDAGDDPAEPEADMEPDDVTAWAATPRAAPLGRRDVTRWAHGEVRERRAARAAARLSARGATS